MKSIPDGVWPTMITPFTEGRAIDYGALEQLVEWYVGHGAAGLFAVCQSSEMFLLTLRERLELARACVRLVRGRVSVIASGHVAEDPEEQIEEARMMADTGVDAVVLITNRLAAGGEGDEVFRRNLERFIRETPDDLLLGFYECPYPYKRLLTPELMSLGVQSGRFGFLKDTSCSLASMRAKMAAARGSVFKLFNANAATLLESLRAGASGYSGVMAAFQGDLYAWLCRNWRSEPERAAELQDFLGMCSLVEYQLYPINAMYALSLEGLPIRAVSRRVDAAAFSESKRLEVAQMMRVSRAWSARYR